MQTERRAAMHNKKETIELINEILQKLSKSELIAIYQALKKIIPSNSL